MDAQVYLSDSTWQQPWPPAANPKRLPVLAEMVDRVQALGGRRARVAVDGRTAAGKTTLGHELAWMLSRAGRAVFWASLDDFKRPWAERHLFDRESGEGYYRNAFDLDAIRRLLLVPAHPGPPGATPRTTGRTSSSWYGSSPCRPTGRCPSPTRRPTATPRTPPPT